MSSPERSELAAVVEAIRANDRFLLVTHENPDGDALGSIRAMKLVLDALGKDNVAYLGGGINLIVPDASSTGEIVADLLRELGVTLTAEIAEPIYVAVVTDTGRFQYTNTTAKALRLAAELVEAGADVHDVFQRVYENVPFAK